MIEHADIRNAYLDDRYPYPPAVIIPDTIPTGIAITRAMKSTIKTPKSIFEYTNGSKKKHAANQSAIGIK